MRDEGTSSDDRRPIGRTRRFAGATRLLAVAIAVAALPALAASAAQAVEPPVITGVSPDHGELGFEGIDEHPPITISGEHLAGATVTAAEFWRESGEQEFEVVEDSETSLVVRALFADWPGVRQLIVHTPGGSASGSVTYKPNQVGTLPVIGRCVQGGPEGGEYVDSKCRYKLAPEEGVIRPEGKFDWSEHLASTTVDFSGGAFKFRFAPQITCTSVDGTGTMLNGREVNNVVLTFHGCEYLGAACTNTATAGDVETFPLLFSLGWWKKKFPKGKRQPAVGVFPEILEGTIAQFRCGPESIAFGGGWEAALKATKAKTSLPFAFGVTKESEHGEEFPMFREQWPPHSAQVVPLMKIDGEDNGMAGPYGTFSMTAPEPFLVNKDK